LASGGSLEGSKGYLPVCGGGFEENDYRMGFKDQEEAIYNSARHLDA
jgi:hypothetical protein